MQTDNATGGSKLPLQVKLTVSTSIPPLETKVQEAAAAAGFQREECVRLLNPGDGWKDEDPHSRYTFLHNKVGNMGQWTVPSVVVDKSRRDGAQQFHLKSGDFVAVAGHSYIVGAVAFQLKFNHATQRDWRVFRSTRLIGSRCSGPALISASGSLVD
jgi:hypothetical protein